MSECKHRKPNGVCVQDVEVVYRGYCVDGPCSCFEPQTNADCIRSMTTEDLSGYLYNHDFCIEPVKSNGQNLCDGDCKKCIEDWLKSPVEEET